MAHITREDGELFVIPSYRDVISTKKTALLRREILLLSENYGEYIALQRKNVNQYEVAFSPEPGYLLGESIWSYFKRPQDLIYCEEIPDTSEVLLVIVKAGSVYLDGLFPKDVIADELVIFRTQQNYFEIYTYGDVPISDVPVDGKFSFDKSSVRSFTALEAPVFPTLPVNRAFQLQLVDTVLKSKGIGGIPVKAIIIIILVLGALWMGWLFLVGHKKELPQVIIRATDPFQLYVNALNSPDPSQQLRWIALQNQLFTTIPGWNAVAMSFTQGTLDTSVKSQGATTHLLFDWAKKNNAQVVIQSDGFHVRLTPQFYNRYPPKDIHYMNSVIAALVDSLATVLPGNPLTLGNESDKGRYFERQVTITIANATAGTIALVADQLKNLPLVLDNVSITIDSNGFLNGTVILRALGN